MQYIQKQHKEPVGWNEWFTVPPNRRTFDYGADYSALTNLKLAKAFLIKEQNDLCAYCQQKIAPENASIEHVAPKEHNRELSTSYFNLVAVCKKQQIPDPKDNKLHCDSTRGSKLLPLIIFYANAQSTSDSLNKYFDSYSDGSIIAKRNLDQPTKNQVESFIEILNLNHSTLKNKRAKDTLNGIISASHSFHNPAAKNRFWRAQYHRILNHVSHPFREYLLVYIGSKIGLH